MDAILEQALSSQNLGTLIDRPTLLTYYVSRILFFSIHCNKIRFYDVLPTFTFDSHISKSEKSIFDKHILIQQPIILMTFLDLMHDSPFFHTRLVAWMSRNVNINESLVYEESMFKWMISRITYHWSVCQDEI